MSGNVWAARLVTAAAVLAALYLAVGGIASQLAGRTVLADTDYMMRYGEYANAGYGESQSKNLMQSDIYTSEIPAEALFAKGVKSGKPSAWDPYIVGGTPLGSITNNALASPLTAPYYVLPSWLAPAYERLAEVVVGLTGLYLFLRRLKLSPPAALVGGMAYVSGAYMVAWQGWPQTRVGAFVPLVFWAVERFIQQRRFRDMAILAVAIAGLLLGGFPSVEGYSLLTVGVYALVRTRKPGQLAGLAAGVGAGVGLAMFQVLPFAKFYSSWLIEGRAQNGADHLDPLTFLTSFAPWAFGGVASNGQQLFYLDPNAVEALGYVGAAVLVLAVVGVMAIRRGRMLLPRGVWVFFVAATALWMLLIYHGGFLLTAGQHVPVLRSLFGANFIGRARCVSGLLVACLAAVGFEVVLRKRSEFVASPAAERGRLAQWIVPRMPRIPGRPGLARWAAPAWSGAVLLAVVLEGWTLVSEGHRVAVTDGPKGYNGSDASAANQVPVSTYSTEIHHGLVLIAAAALLVALLWLVSWFGGSVRRLGLVRVLAACGVVAMVAAEGTSFIGRFTPSADKSTFYPVTDTQEFLAANLGHSRYASTADASVLGTDSIYGLRALNGHAFLNSAFATLVRGVPGDPVPGPTRLSFEPDEAQATSPILDRLGVAYFTASPNEPVFGTTHPATTDGSETVLQPNVPVTVRLPVGDDVRALGLVPTSSDDVSAYAPNSDNNWIEISVTDDSGTVTSKRLTQGIQTGIEFDVPIPLDSPAQDGTRTATITLHSTKATPLAVQGLAGAPSLATVTNPGDGLKLVYAGSSVIYQRLNAMPRIRWADSSVVVSDAASRVSLLASGALDASTVVLNSGSALSAPNVLSAPGSDSGTPAGAASSSASNSAAGIAGATAAGAVGSPPAGTPAAAVAATSGIVDGGLVTVTSDGLDSVGAQVNTAAPGYLVVADSDQVGWSATVDGKAARLVPADQGLVAVSVPAGTHTVKLRYKSPDNGFGGYASAATAFALAGGVGVETWCSRRGRMLPWELAWTRVRARRAAAAVPGGGAGSVGSAGSAGSVTAAVVAAVDVGARDVGARDVGAAAVGEPDSGDGDARGPDVREDAGV
ncbi:hypothetical protein ABH935_008924 [Catenulispora sp. GAS73]|uniref:hypothetical protein n=1 Tax=Catenulispora sp. GAS73 TaxID=3156269 RepID=UPI00351296D3